MERSEMRESCVLRVLASVMFVLECVRRLWARLPVSDPPAMGARNFTYNFTYKTQFFSHVTNSVVIAVTEGDVGHPQVEEMLDRITSWTISALEREVMVTFLTWGKVTYQEGGVAVHEMAQDPHRQADHRIHIMEDDVWSVFSLDREILVKGDRLHLYAALNVGREGWCVLTSDFHTMIHVLRDHGMAADHLTGLDTCDASCTHRQDGLVPRAWASLRRHPQHLRRLRHLGSLRKQVVKMLTVVQSLLPQNQEAGMMCQTLHVQYINECDTELSNSCGWCLVAGFDIKNRKHQALGRKCSSDMPVILVHDEQDTRGFLLAVSPLLRTCEQAIRNAFLRSYTHIHAISWDEASAIISGTISLRDFAFRSVCQLPFDYVDQHAPPQLCRRIRNRHNIIPWKSESELKKRVPRVTL